MITRGDLDYTALWILYAATSLAEIEVISAGRLVDREVIPLAASINPAFFTTIYTDLLNRKKSRARFKPLSTPSIATSRSERSSSSRWCWTTCATPARRGRASELDAHFTRHYDVGHASMACEYLADRGLIGKVSLPVTVDQKEQRRHPGTGVRLSR